MIYSISCSPTIEREIRLDTSAENTREIEFDPDGECDFLENDDFQELDPEDFATDRGWWYRCRHCECHTRVHTTAPYCRQCGFSQQIPQNGKGA